MVGGVAGRWGDSNSRSGSMDRRDYRAALCRLVAQDPSRLQWVAGRSKPPQRLNLRAEGTRAAGHTSAMTLAPLIRRQATPSPFAVKRHETHRLAFATSCQMGTVHASISIGKSYSGLNS